MALEQKLNDFQSKIQSLENTVAMRDYTIE